MTRKLTLATVTLLCAMPFGVMAASPADTPMPPAGSPPAVDSGRPADSRERPTSPAPADKGAADKASPQFQKLDTNSDGYLTKEEVSSAPDIKKRFKEIDGDHDGKISAYEFANGSKGG